MTKQKTVPIQASSRAVSDIMLWELDSETCILQTWMWGEGLFTKNQQKMTRTVPTRNKATYSPHCSP